MIRCYIGIHKWEHLYDWKLQFGPEPAECDKTSCVQECERCGTTRSRIDDEWIYRDEL